MISPWFPAFSGHELRKNGAGANPAGLGGEGFSRCVKPYPPARDTPALSARDHFAAMVSAQLTDRESLRDIEACLKAAARCAIMRGFAAR